MTVDNGARVIMTASHPHEGRTGQVKLQPGEPGGVAGMYLIAFDGPFEGNAYAGRDDFRVLPAGSDETSQDDALLWQAREALRLTREYVWPETRLPKIEGWSWWDAVVAIDRRLGVEVGAGIMDDQPVKEKPTDA